MRGASRQRGDEESSRLASIRPLGLCWALCFGLLVLPRCDPPPCGPDAGSGRTSADSGTDAGTDAGPPPDGGTHILSVVPASVSVVAGGAPVALSAFLDGAPVTASWTLTGPGSLSVAT